MKKSIKLNLNKEELIKFQLDLILNYKSKKYNDTDLVCLAFLYLYGYKKGKFEIESRKITLNNAVWANKLSEFRETGIIMGKGENTILSDKIKLYPDLKELNIHINDT